MNGNELNSIVRFAKANKLMHLPFSVVFYAWQFAAREDVDSILNPGYPINSVEEYKGWKLSAALVADRLKTKCGVANTSHKGFTLRGVYRDGVREYAYDVHFDTFGGYCVRVYCDPDLVILDDTFCIIEEHPRSILIAPRVSVCNGINTYHRDVHEYADYVVERVMRLCKFTTV